MSQTLGEKLRAAREERGISISEVAEQTRISPLYIESIEKDDFKVLPGGIFNKGFVRSFAKYVGVDEHEALQDYQRQTTAADASNADEPPTYRPEVLTDDRSSSSMLPTIVFAGIILALMTGGILFLVNYIQNQPEKPAADANASPAPASNTVTSNSSSTSSESGTPPTWETIKIEFKAVNEPISLGSILDGKSSESMLQPDQPLMFEPKESLTLRYAKTRAAFATLSINGKPITLPTEPENPKRSAIEFTIDRGNFAQIWQAGTVTVAPDSEASPAATATPAAATAPVATPVQTPPAASNAATPPPATPRPAPASTPQRPRPTPTPIVVGRPANAAAPRPTP